jgi:hypothetical protein
VKDRLSREIALEGVAVLYGDDFLFELLAQVGEALLLGCTPGGFVGLGEATLLFGSHEWCVLSG